MFRQGAFQLDPNATPDQIARKRELIRAMMPKYGSAKYVGEGLGQLFYAIGSGRQENALDRQEAAGRKSAAELFDRLVNGAGNTSYSSSGGGTPSGTWTPAPPPPSPVDIATTGMDVAKSGGLSFGLPQADPGVFGAGKEKLDFGAAVMTPQEMLIEGATRRGLDPVDVATAISYETGGKFDPMISGPTTQWGTHRGLIQFGEPQAQQHGVDFSNPDAAWRSQLNPETGAVWSYLDGAGVKPGMGLPEIYSGINAGSVGRMNASDANNGGAPGTVADKVASMGPHREKAAQFLGGTWTPDPNAPQGQTTTVSTKGTGGGISTNDLLAAMANPWLDPQQRAILTGMYEDQVRQADPMYQAQVRKAELELAQLENPTQQPPEDFTERMFTLTALGIDPQSEEGKHYIMTGQLPEPPEPGFTTMTPEEVAQLGLPPGSYQRGPKGEIKQIGGGGQTINVNTGSEVGTIPQGFELFTDPVTGARSMRPIPGGPEDTSKNDTKKANNAETAASVVTTAADRALAASKERAFGGVGQGLVSNIPWTDSAEVARQVEVLKANAKVDNLQAMRDASPTGGALGSVTEGETQMLAAKSGALDPSSPNFERDLADYTRTLLRVVHGPEDGDRIFAQTWKGEMPAEAMPQGSSEPANITNDAEYDALPSGAVYVGPDGVKRRKP